MAHLELRANWTVTLTSAEMALIRRALREQLRTGETEPARQLDLALARMQIAQVEHISGEYEKLRRNIEEATHADSAS